MSPQRSMKENKNTEFSIQKTPHFSEIILPLLEPKIIFDIYSMDKRSRHRNPKIE